MTRDDLRRIAESRLRRPVPEWVLDAMEEAVGEAGKETVLAVEALKTIQDQPSRAAEVADTYFIEAENRELARDLYIRNAAALRGSGDE